MATERVWVLPACLGVGAAALVFAFLPATWPVPLADGPATSALLPGLRASAAAVDAACARGDEAAFASVTTAAHRRTLARRLSAFDGALDAAALRAMASRRQADFLFATPLAGEVRGARSAVVVPREDGEGSQVLVFEWNGQRWCLDDSHHAVAVRDEETARAVVAEAVARRER